MIRPFASLLALSLVVSTAAAEPVVKAPAVTLASTAQEAVKPQPKLQLRPEVMLTTDLVRFGDLFAGLSGELAGQAAFRAPALGETGTIQVSRIIHAARAAGVLPEASETHHESFAPGRRDPLRPPVDGR